MQLDRSDLQVHNAIDTGLKAQQEFEESLKNKGREILANLSPDSRLFVIVSRPYNGCDPGVSLELPSKLAELGLEAIPIDMLDLESSPMRTDSLYSSVYWSYGQRILRAGEMIKRDPRLFAIYLSNFSCGPDSFLQTFFKDIMGQKPCLQLELDEHSADAGVITRIEAFVESLKHYDCKYSDMSRKVSVDRAPALGRRTIFLPYMGDCSYGMEAAFKAFGQPAKVMPPADEDILVRGRKFTTGKECLPCTITAGDMLKVLEENEPDKVAFFMPSANGPCRFGMYNRLHQLILQQAGFEDVPIIAPNQDSSFYNEIVRAVDGYSFKDLPRYAWAVMAGIDLLQKVLLRIRPYALDPQQADAAYEKALQQWLEIGEAYSTLRQMRRTMGSIADDFNHVPIDRTLNKPRIGVVGEIYVRNHPFANSNIIRRLEQLGAECDLAAIIEWIYYTNYIRGKKFCGRDSFSAYLGNIGRDFVQHYIEKKARQTSGEEFWQTT